MKILNAVIAYKDFEWNDLSADELKNYFVFTPNEIKTNIPHVCKYDEIDGYDNRIYGELSHHQFISKNIDFEWIVINQYRRRFELSDYGHIYVPTPLTFKESVKDVYSYFHNETDLDVMTDIVMESNIEDSFKIEWLKSLDDKTMICYNMFAGPKELYLEWLEICLGYLNTFKKIKRFTNYNKVLKYYRKINKDKKGTHKPYRVYGFLCERLTNCYFRWYSKKHNDILNFDKPVYPCNVKLLEEDMII